MTSMGTPALRMAAAEAALAAAAVAPALIDQATTDTSAAAWTALAGYGAVALGCLALRRHRPLTAFGVLLAVLAAVQVAAAAAEVKPSGLTVLPVAFALYAAGAYSAPRRSGAALLLGAALVAGGLAANHLTAPEGWRGGSDVLAYVAALPVAWALGVAARGHRGMLAAAERRAADARREQHLLAERAAAAERVRIARDMHDVVAHSLTLLVVHAETVRARSGELPPWARERVDAMAAAGRQATSEMRELLQVLRDGGTTAAPGITAAPRAPAPTLAGLPALVEAARTAGNPTSLTVTGDMEELPRTVQLTGYRVVQEGLANARRHAPGAEVAVRIDACGHDVSIEIDSGAPDGDVTPAPGAGIGLHGLEERLAALGGTLDAGATPGGGFRVAATIPVGARDAVR
ncbi:sensor histidine kinase [Actinomadura geliboluensis]|uniref:sensor histidine kinase n=1 Tax=Actinomadura geliboluensis TaxID=882440 RepID=UPI0037159A04